MQALQQAVAISSAATGASSPTQEQADSPATTKSGPQRGVGAASAPGAASLGSAHGSAHTGDASRSQVQASRVSATELSKTAVRALVAQASIQQQAGNMTEAEALLQQACDMDPAVQQLFLKPLQSLMKAQKG